MICKAYGLWTLLHNVKLMYLHDHEKPVSAHYYQNRPENNQHGPPPADVRLKCLEEMVWRKLDKTE